MPFGESEEGIVKTSGVRVIWKPGSFKNKGPGGGGGVPVCPGTSKEAHGPRAQRAQGSQARGRGTLSLRPSQAAAGMSPPEVWAEELTHLTLYLNKPLPWLWRMEGTEVGRWAGGPRGGQMAWTRVALGGW